MSDTHSKPAIADSEHIEPELTDYEIVAPASEWSRIRADPRFAALMRVARTTNSLSLAYGPLLAPLEDQRPGARRDRFAAFFYAAAVLKEALGNIQALGQWYRHLPAFQNGLSAIAADPAVQALRRDLLDRVRNTMVFHYDRAVIQNGVNQFPDGDQVIATYPTAGPSVGGLYVDAADDILLADLFGDAASPAEYLQRLESFMTQVSALHSRYLQAAHRLLAVGLRELGCVKREGKRPLPPSDDPGDTQGTAAP